MDQQQGTPERSSWTSGFTLMEMMIVMALIVILAGIGMTVYGSSVQRSKEAVLKEDLFRMRDAIGPGPANLQVTGTGSAPGGAPIALQFMPVTAVTAK